MAEARRARRRLRRLQLSSRPSRRSREAAAETVIARWWWTLTLTALRQEHETVRSQYMRIAADFDNFRKRQQRDSTISSCSSRAAPLARSCPWSTTLSAPASS